MVQPPNGAAAESSSVHNPGGDGQQSALNPGSFDLQAKDTSSRTTRIIVILLLCASSCFALAWGLALARAARGVILDFKIVYFGARCVVQHRDPYNQNELLRVYLAEGGASAPGAAQGYRTQMIVASQIYLPSAAFLIAPFGLLPWPAAYTLWILLTIVGITAAAALMWSVANQHAPGPAFYLTAFLLFNSGILFSGGNPAGVAVSLCVIAAWCFIRNRAVSFGIVCMAISLAIKPHDAGLVWLYFLIAGAVLRKRALKSLLVTAVIGIIALAWIHQLSPHWLSELEQNVQDYAVRGTYNDPGPAANKTVGTGMIIDLQTVTSVVRDDPDFYRPAAYLLCAPLLAFWAFLTIRTRFSESRAWIGLAAIAPLTLLPVYHRPYDAKLLLLTIPACAMLWSEGRVRAWLSVALTGMAIVFTSDLPLAMLSILSKGMHLPAGPAGGAITILLLRPAPLALSALAAFNLFQYAKICCDGVEESGNTAASFVPIATNRK